MSSRKRAGQIVAVMVVAAALCADRAVAAAPAVRPHLAQTARLVASRLTISFRQVVPSTRVRQERQELPPVPAIPVPLIERAVQAHPAQTSAMFLHLPPPAC